MSLTLFHLDCILLLMVKMNIKQFLHPYFIREKLG